MSTKSIGVLILSLSALVGARLFAGEHAKIRGRVAPPQFPARPGRSSAARSASTSSTATSNSS